MSNAAMNYVDQKADKAMPSGQFFVLYRLADRGTDHSREDWTCFPSIEQLAEDTRLSRSAVERHLQALVAEGWISRKRRVRADGKLGIYDYWIHRADARRAGLKTARARIRELGEKPAETIADLEHPCCESPHGPDGDLGQTMLHFAAEPCGESPQQEPSLEPSTNPHNGAREPGDDGFDRVIAIWPASGAKRTRWPAARAAFAKACDQVAAADLLAAIAACAADPEIAKGDHGWPGLHGWLADERWRVFLPKSGQPPPPQGLASSEAAEAEARTAFAPPAEIAEALAAIGGLESYLAKAAWSDADRTIVAATSIARDRLLERIGRRWLAANDIRIAWARERPQPNAEETRADDDRKQA